MEIGIRDRWDTLDLELLFYEQTPDKSGYYLYDFCSEPGKEKNMVLKTGAAFPADFPRLRVPWQLKEPFIKAIGEYANRQGLKLDSDLRREGLLEATKYHLEDLRRLLKLRKGD